MEEQDRKFIKDEVVDFFFIEIEAVENLAYDLYLKIKDQDYDTITQIFQKHLYEGVSGNIAIDFKILGWVQILVIASRLMAARQGKSYEQVFKQIFLKNKNP